MIKSEIIKEAEKIKGVIMQIQSLPTRSRTGITQPDISKLENGKENPSIGTLKKIAEAFGKKLIVQFV